MKPLKMIFLVICVLGGSSHAAVFLNPFEDEPSFYSREFDAKEITFFIPLSDPCSGLPTDRLYPRGRVFPTWVNSGNFTRDALSGFTLGGPQYVDFEEQLRNLKLAQAAGLRYIFTLGTPGSFAEGTAKDPPGSWTNTIAAQLGAVARDPGVAVWAIHPEELRMWRARARDSLRIVTEVIRANEPLKRPIIVVEPSDSPAENLLVSLEPLDYVCRGADVQARGFQNDRVWVRWIVKQQLEISLKLRAKDGRYRPVWYIAELNSDPVDPADDAKIPEWVRHDVYAALIAGAKGLGFWSRWQDRSSVRRTADAWYNAYAGVVRDLAGIRDMGQVFLFGEDRSDLKVRHVSGPKTVVLWTGPRTDHASNNLDRNPDRHVFSAVAYREIAWRDSRYLFVCNSTAEPVTLDLTGWPVLGCAIENGFTGDPIPFSKSITHVLPPWGTAAYRFKPVEK